MGKEPRPVDEDQHKIDPHACEQACHNGQNVPNHMKRL